MGKKYTLGKTERLKSRKQIDLLFEKGKRVSSGRLTAIYSVFPGEKPLLQAGFGVSTRNFKRAVDRNRIKRSLKESWRLQKNDLKKQLEDHSLTLSVFILFTGKDIPVYDEIYKTTETLLQRLTGFIEK